MNTDSQGTKHEACFVRATQVCLAISQNTSVTSREMSSMFEAYCTGLAAVNHICVIHEDMNGCKKSKGSLKDCFKSVNILEKNSIFGMFMKS